MSQPWQRPEVSKARVKEDTCVIGGKLRSISEGAWRWTRHQLRRSVHKGLRERATKFLKGLCVGTGDTAPEEADGNGAAPTIERDLRESEAIANRAREGQFPVKLAVPWPVDAA